MRSAYVSSLPVAIFLLAGCFAKQADLDAVRREQRSMRATLADTRVSVDNLRTALDETRARMTETMGVARPAAGLRDLERRVAQLEARLAAVEVRGATAPAMPSPPAQVEAGAPAPQGSPVSGGTRGTPAAAIAMQSEEAMLPNAPAEYQAALDLYRQGRWAGAVEKFRQFLQKSPRSELADNAQYWIGECFYSQSDYNRAIIELNEVLLKYPQGNRVPGALLALATAFADSGDPIDARLIVQKLISDHPESEEAKIGRQKLQELSR